MKLILEYDKGNLEAQLSAVEIAKKHLNHAGDMCGVKVGPRYFGVKRNRASIRVYVHDETKQ